MMAMKVGFEISLARSRNEMNGFRLAFVNDECLLSTMFRKSWAFFSQLLSTSLLLPYQSLLPSLIFFADCGNGDDGGVEISLVRGEGEIEAFAAAFQTGLSDLMVE
ncbi:hypothetical protein Sjap_007730 [Stephania japonica]|uniref:Uncharacterized protein n=1 Tax=Stephania japonica TaxID=461633 RepID=A0AAP0JN56_9MAGN